MLLRPLFLVCLIFASLPSLSQESGTAGQRVPGVPGDTVVGSKAGIAFVEGDVHRPTRVVLEKTGHITVLRALAIAEGANPTANLHKAKIIRKDENGTTKIPLDIRKIMEAKAPDVTLQADDILFVPRSASKSSMQKIENLYYDVAPSAPLQDAAPIYIR
jgi:protein involved in polysaccharide export with SLBB domain